MKTLLRVCLGALVVVVELARAGLTSAQPTSYMGDRRFEALAAGENHACGIAKGQLLCWGLNASGQLGDGTLESRLQPAEVLLSASVVSVTAGRAHT